MECPYYRLAQYGYCGKLYKTALEAKYADNYANYESEAIEMIKKCPFVVK